MTSLEDSFLQLIELRVFYCFCIQKDYVTASLTADINKK